MNVENKSVTSLSKQISTDKIELWKKCDVNKLAEHFHCYRPLDSQFERLSTVNLNDETIKWLLLGNGKITSFEISFGLDEKVSPAEKFTFSPVISVVYSNKDTGAAGFHHVKKTRSMPPDGVTFAPDVAEVPEEFKDWMVKNWIELDVSLIDDVFKATPKKKVGESMTRRDPQRLLKYCFTETTNSAFLKFINDIIENNILIERFYFHLGVDMNKFNHKEEFGFAPVLEVQIPKTTDEFLLKIHRAGLRSKLMKNAKEEDVEGVYYYEYLTPCPSTCA
jgi:hypothetical protein